MKHSPYGSPIPLVFVE